jgi:SLBB domain
MRGVLLILALVATVSASTEDRLHHYQGIYHHFFEWYPAAAPRLPVDASEYIVVLGFVKKPGVIKPREGLTLTKALAECGGFKDFAWRTRIGVWNNAKGQFILVSVHAIERHEIPDPSLMKGDMVFVDQYWMTGI